MAAAILITEPIVGSASNLPVNTWLMMARICRVPQPGRRKAPMLGAGHAQCRCNGCNRCGGYDPEAEHGASGIDQPKQEAVGEYNTAMERT